MKRAQRKPPELTQFRGSPRRSMYQIGGMIPVKSARRLKAVSSADRSPLAAHPRAGWLASLDELFGIDYRSLAVFRVATACLLLMDLAVRVGDLRAHYTDWGVLPRFWLLQKGNVWFFSLHLFSGEAWGQTLLFLAHAVVLFGMLVGYRTRLTTVLSWVLLVSLHNRNPLLLNSGDTLIRCLLFFGMFLPLGAVFSVDKALGHNSRPTGARHLSVASGAILVQMGLMYFISSLIKTGPEWHELGSAVYITLNLDQMATSFGQWFRQFESILPFFTEATWYLEFVGPLLMFCPIGLPWLRHPVVAAFAAFHFGLFLCLGIGLFPFFAAAGLCLFLPSGFWNWISRRASKRPGETATLYFDGECGFCRTAVAILREVLLLGDRVELREAQAEPAIEALMRKKNSWVLLGGQGAPTYGSDAFRKLLKRSPLFFWLSPLTDTRVMQAALERGYRWASANRRLLGHLTKALRAPRRSETPVGVWGQTLAGAAFAVVVLWNLSTLKDPDITFTSSTDWVARIPRLDQNWKMFAPTPLLDDGWYVVPGKLKNGREVDAFGRREGPVTWEKPELGSVLYENERWRKYLMNLWKNEHRENWLYYGKYLCRSWNQNRVGDEQLGSFEIVFMLERFKDGVKAPARKVSLAKHKCG